MLPVMKEIAPGKLSVIGTGFYVTRYGLFVSARHVLEELRDGPTGLKPAYVVHHADEERVHFRRILSVTLSNTTDVGLGQADNYSREFPKNPLINLRASLTTSTITPGSAMLTYAYPENKILDFTSASETAEITADFYQGVLLETADPTPLLPYLHYMTTIELRSGASGGPVFVGGKVVGVNCRGWDFRGSEHEGDNLSSVTPVSLLLPISVPFTALQIPELSWEYEQVPASRRAGHLTVGELGEFGHILVEPLP